MEKKFINILHHIDYEGNAYFGKITEPLQKLIDCGYVDVITERKRRYAKLTDKGSKFIQENSLENE